jgi:hypothetical protein
MTDTTPRVGAPLLAAAQAQKHVTHNEALYQFDAVLCACFISRTLTAPPSSPSDGDTYLVATGGTGTWLGQDGNIAYCADGSWRFYTPFAGLTAYVTAESKLIVWSGSAWVDFASMIATQNLPMVGVNTTADSTNKLSVQSNAVLFADLATGSGGTGDIRATLSKQASGNTASFLFQDNFSGRAEIGLAGDDNFHFKVSPDGSAWTDAMDIAASTGCVSIANADIDGGTVDAAAIGASTPSSGKFTTLQATGAVTHTPSNANVTLSPTGTGKVVVAPATAGTMDNVAVGQTTPAAGAFSSLTGGAAGGGSSADVHLTGTASHTYVLAIQSSSGFGNMVLCPDGLTVSASGENSANCMMKVRKDSTTNRSINAVGTVNAGGADYAEYEEKRSDCGAVAKGQIVGFDADGLVTDAWAEAVSFGIKSTNPSYVGGDTWGSEDAAGQEAARARVDRIAYSGKVPCNVTASRVGDYVVAVASGTGIAGQAICASAITFDQYRRAVGRVRRIVDAAHCIVSVIVH